MVLIGRGSRSTQSVVASPYTKASILGGEGSHDSSRIALNSRGRRHHSCGVGDPPLPSAVGRYGPDCAARVRNRCTDVDGGSAHRASEAQGVAHQAYETQGVDFPLLIADNASVERK